MVQPPEWGKLVFIDPEWFMEEEDHYVIKGQNRRAKRDKIERSKEAFMKLNGRGLISDTLPILEKKGKKEKK